MKYLDLSTTKHFIDHAISTEYVRFEYIEKNKELDQYIHNELLVNFGDGYDSFYKCRLAYVDYFDYYDFGYHLYCFRNVQYIEPDYIFYQDNEFNEFNLDEEDKWFEFNYSDDGLQEYLKKYMDKDIVVVLHDKIILGMLKEINEDKKIALIVDIDVFDKSEANGENEDK